MIPAAASSSGYVDAEDEQQQRPSSSTGSATAPATSTGSSKRQDYLSWDEYFIGVALLTSQRSKDPCTQVSGLEHTLHFLCSPFRWAP